MSTSGGIVILSEMLSFLPPSEKKIATYIIQNPQEAISLTAKELGTRSSTSGAAVIRLCKSLNLNGFQDLKLRIAGDLQKKNTPEFSDIEPNEPLRSVIEKMTNNTIQTIRKTADLINVDEVEKAVQVLRNARRIHFIGIGASGIIAQDAEQKFIRINKTAYAYTDTHMAATQIANANEEDVVVGISFSGETIEVAKLLQLARSKNVRTISLTKYGNHKVTEYADIKLFISVTTEPTFRSGATFSRMAQLQVIDILFMSVASLQYDETLMHLNATREAIEFLKSNGKKNNN
ncbi:MurR/RpiR family transcriptional regulator [Oceanobacillus bengalensis]|uniref:MurR/RpiR family transcriptional regulator n=1 Tax=Oceanobacillus bengalensis TaxID=1435466 RepID=A0A494YZU5_9BACI|nr:MurR/RpiR family transcriptional regulator [Oceanobacillus bengalensis]RKQ15700.1 MurR/RpiR family transcriptional regulator [Oceanobacillus bengalensis]